MNSTERRSRRTFKRDRRIETNAENVQGEMIVDFTQITPCVFSIQVENVPDSF